MFNGEFLNIEFIPRCVWFMIVIENLAEVYD